MATISTALRHFKEPTKEQLTEIFFSVPPSSLVPDAKPNGQEPLEKLEINATLTVAEAEEDSYVSATHLKVLQGRLSLHVVTIGREAIHHTPISCFHVGGSEICQIHGSSLHHSARRAA